MADSLDDFFAKKDKKRGKDKNKSALSAEALVRELEEGSRQNDYPIRKDNKTSTAIEILGLDSNDADWKDFEEVERRDYSGLKVKEMSLQDQNEEEQRRLMSEQTEPVPESTAWKIKEETSSAIAPETTAAKQKQQAAENTTIQSTTKSDASKTVSSSSEQKVEGSGEPDEAKTGSSSEDASKKDGDSKKPSAKAYVPPHERMGSSEFKVLEPIRLGKLKTSSSRHGATPDIQDERAFPSLG